MTLETELAALALETLRADEALTELTGGQPRVFDAVPRDAGFPRVTLDSVQTVQDEDPDGLDTDDVALSFSIFSRPDPPSLGKTEALAVARRVRTLLLGLRDRRLNAGRVVETEPDLFTVAGEADGLTHRGVVAVLFRTSAPDMP